MTGFWGLWKRALFSSPPSTGSPTASKPSHGTESQADTSSTATTQAKTTGNQEVDAFCDELGPMLSQLEHQTRHVGTLLEAQNRTLDR